MPSIVGTYTCYRGSPEEQECICCPPNTGHVYGRSIKIEPYPSIFAGLRVEGVQDFLHDELSKHKEWEGKKIRVTVEPIEEHKKLKVFVWQNIFRDATYGMAVALAHDGEEARQIIVNKMGWTHEDLVKSPQVFDLDECEPAAFYVFGGS